jgi:hypothetical protein
MVASSITGSPPGEASAMATSVSTLPSVVDEARRLVDAGRAKGVPLRLIGGAAVLVRSEGVTSPTLAREIKDIDLATSKAHGAEVAGLLESTGYTPNLEFNAFQGHRRLLFYDQTWGRQVDVFIGAFVMCHSIPLESRLEVDALTIPLAELVLTKAQIVKLNQKDLVDLCRLFLSHDSGASDGELINAARIAELCSVDWGLEHTVRLNLDRVRAGLAVLNLSAGDTSLVARRIDVLLEAVSRAPKSRRWRWRATIGERIPWYEEPDEE